MAKDVESPHLDLWTLVSLSQELNDAIRKLGRIAAEIPAGRSNPYLFKSAICQIKTCGYRLEIALDQYSNAQRGA